MKRKRVILWSVAGVVAIAVAVCALRWHAWFAQPDEAPYTPEPWPHRVLLTPGNSGELSRNVSWQCDTAVRPSYLQLVSLADTTDTLRIDARGEVFNSRAGKAAYYVARLDRLQPDTRYSYRVVSGADASPWYGFATHGTGNRHFAFVYVGDVQDTIGTHANELLRLALSRHPDAEMLVSGGDLTERPRDADWQQTFVALDSIATAIPVMAVTGNHDYLKGVISKLERRFSLVFSYFLDSMIGENQVYRLRYGNAEFFLLDSFREFPYLYTQSRWLRKSLADSDAPWKIVVMHHPLHSLRGKGTTILRWMFDDVISEGGVDLVLCGHEHNYARLGDGTNGPVYIMSHCSPKVYNHKHDADFDAVDLDSRYYQYVDVGTNELTVTTYRLPELSVADRVVIKK